MNVTAKTAIAGNVRDRIEDRHDRRDARRDFRQALRSDDLESAKKAYVELVKSAPAGATWNPDGAFAKVGQALKEGDLEAAKGAFAELREDRKQQVVPPGTEPISLPAPEPVLSGTATVPGSLIDTTA